MKFSPSIACRDHICSGMSLTGVGLMYNWASFWTLLCQQTCSHLPHTDGNLNLFFYAAEKLLTMKWTGNLSITEITVVSALTCHALGNLCSNFCLFFLCRLRRKEGAPPEQTGKIYNIDLQHKPQCPAKCACLFIPYRHKNGFIIPRWLVKILVHTTKTNIQTKTNILQRSQTKKTTIRNSQNILGTKKHPSIHPTECTIWGIATMTTSAGKFGSIMINQTDLFFIPRIWIPIAVNSHRNLLMLNFWCVECF